MNAARTAAHPFQIIISRGTGRNPYRGAVMMNGNTIGFGGACKTREAALLSAEREGERIMRTLVLVADALTSGVPNRDAMH